MLDDVDLFLLVAVHGSVNKAAKQLRLPKSTVSRRLANLEALPQSSAREMDKVRALRYRSTLVDRKSTRLNSSH